jgi:hypothetical protein
MRSLRLTGFAAAAALATALVAGCGGDDDTAAPSPTNPATTSAATSAPGTSSSAAAASGNTKQVCDAAEESLDEISEEKMKNDVIAEGRKNGGNAEKAGVTVFKRNMNKVVEAFRTQGEAATDPELKQAFTVSANALGKAVDEVKSLSDLDDMATSKALSAPDAKAASKVIGDKCGGKLAEGF